LESSKRRPANHAGRALSCTDCAGVNAKRRRLPFRTAFG
jgi:hypothetical protein